MTLGERIKQLRIKKGMTQLELANSLSVTDRAISKWEQGRGNPDIMTIPTIASLFNVSVDYLLTGEEHSPSLDNQQSELISYFESVIEQELSNEFLKRLIVKHLETYSVPKIKDALDSCYDSYLLKKTKPLGTDDIKDALSKLGGILYNNDLPILERRINRLMFYLKKNTLHPNPSYRNECEDSLRRLLKLFLDQPDGDKVALQVVDDLYRDVSKGKMDYRLATEYFKQVKREINKRQKWDEIDASSEHAETSPFVSIGNEKLRLSVGACRLVNNFNLYQYVSFTRTKQDRIYFVGLRFEKTKSENSYHLYKDNDPDYGAVIYAKDLLNTLYGKESMQSTYTKHDVILDPENSNMLVVYYNYKNKYYIDGDEKKPIRTKHIGSIVNNNWMVISSKSKAANGKNYPTYVLQNIDTDEEVEVSTRGLIDIERGLTTVESIMASREMGINTYRGKRRAEKKKRIKELNIEDKQKNNSESSEELNTIKETQLFKELKALRRAIALEKNVSAFVISGDKTLISIVTSKPKNKDELLSCYGFTKKKYDLFGEKVLSIVSKHLDD